MFYLNSRFTSSSTFLTTTSIPATFPQLNNDNINNNNYHQTVNQLFNGNPESYSFRTLYFS